MQREREIELEKLKLEENNRREQQREKEKEREMELEKMKLEREFKLRELEITNARSPTFAHEHVDITKYARLVPLFNEQQVDSYFNSFEKVAIINSWPKDKWVALLQGVLTGTARNVFDSLSVEDSLDYDLVKDSILKAYERIPEFYRQQFRSYRKQVNQTYVEFSMEKVQIFDRWCDSEEINKS